MDEPVALIRRLAGRDRIAAAAARESLAALGAAAVPALSEALRVGLGAERAAVAEVLAALGAPAVPALRSLAGDDNPEVRLWVAWILGHLRDVAAPDVLLPLAGDAHLEVRRMALQALADRGYPERTGALVAALGAADAGLRRQAAEALGATQDPAAVPPLIAALGDADAGVRARAARALGLLGAGRAVEPLLEMATAEDGHGCQAAAVEALGRIGDTQALGPLVRLVQHGDDRRAQLAAEALAGIGAPAVEPLCALLPAMVGFGNAPHAVIAGRLGDGLTPRGTLVVRTLARIGREAVPALCAVLTRPDTVHARRQTARALLDVAKLNPCIELRGALGPLRARLGPFAGEADYLRAEYRAAIEAIEAATESLADLPRPAVPTAPQNLPRPAEAPETAPEDLPLPAGPA